MVAFPVEVFGTALTTQTPATAFCTTASTRDAVDRPPGTVTVADMAGLVIDTTPERLNFALPVTLRAVAFALLAATPTPFALSPRTPVPPNARPATPKPVPLFWPYTPLAAALVVCPSTPLPVPVLLPSTPTWGPSPSTPVPCREMPKTPLPPALVDSLCA